LRVSAVHIGYTDGPWMNRLRPSGQGGGEEKKRRPVDAAAVTLINEAP
jgi:hypothetical protein